MAGADTPHLQCSWHPNGWGVFLGPVVSPQGSMGRPALMRSQGVMQCWWGQHGSSSFDEVSCSDGSDGVGQGHNGVKVTMVLSASFATCTIMDLLKPVWRRDFVRSHQTASHLFKICAYSYSLNLQVLLFMFGHLGSQYWHIACYVDMVNLLAYSCLFTNLADVKQHQHLFSYCHFSSPLTPDGNKAMRTVTVNQNCTAAGHKTKTITWKTL